MKKTKQLGIWMDHSVAYVMEFTTKPFEIQTIVKEFHRNDTLAVQNERNSLFTSINTYYNQIAEAIVSYDQLILFGPSHTKVDFFDLLSEDHRFLKMKVEIKETDNMNVNEQHAFIHEYFIQ